MRSWNDILGEGFSEKDLLSAKLRISFDFEYFFSKILGFGTLNPMQEGIFRLFSLDENFIPERKHVCVLAPRQHGKTTFCIAFLLWIAYNSEYMLTLKHYSKYPWVNCLIVSGSQTQSTDIMELIKYHIDTNEALKHLKPEVSSKESKWSSSDVRLNTNCYIRSRPFTSAIRGGTYHFVLCDDLLRDSSITQSETIKTYMETIIPTTSETEGMQMLVGTPQTSSDLFSYIENEVSGSDKVYDFKRFEAMRMDGDGEWVGVLWPEKYNVKKLLDMKQIQGPISFAKEYLCDPKQAGEALWSYDIIKGCLDDFKPVHGGRVGYNYYMGVDIAFSNAPTADYGVLAVIECDVEKKQHPRLVYLYRKKGWRPEEYENKIRSLHENFDFTVIEIENRGLSIDLVTRLEEDPYLGGMIKSFKVKRGGFGAVGGDKERIITRLHTATVNGTLRFPKKGGKDYEVLFNEMMHFGIKERDGKESYEALAGHDDTVMALAMAYDAFVNPSTVTTSLTII